MDEKLTQRLERLAALLRTLRETAHEYDGDLAAALDLAAEEADAISKSPVA